MKKITYFTIECYKDDGTSHGVLWYPHEIRGWAFPSADAAIETAKKHLMSLPESALLPWRDGYEHRLISRAVYSERDFRTWVVTLDMDRERRDSYLKPETKTVVIDGAEYSRTEKVLHVGPWEKVQTDYNNTVSLYIVEKSMKLAAPLSDFAENEQVGGLYPPGHPDFVLPDR